MTDEHEHQYDSNGMQTALRNSEAAQTLELNVWHERVPIDVACSDCGEVAPFLLTVYLSKRPTPLAPGEVWTPPEAETLSYDDFPDKMTTSPTVRSYIRSRPSEPNPTFTLTVALAQQAEHRIVDTLPSRFRRARRPVSRSPEVPWGGHVMPPNAIVVTEKRAEKGEMGYPLRSFEAGRAASTVIADATVSMPILAYCAEEVRRQGDTPWHVYRMARAWLWALNVQASREPLNHWVVQTLGALIDEANKTGYRTGSVRVGASIKPGPDAVSGLMADLLREQDQLPPEEFYRRFEEIHPFMDGNGRTGKVLYNWLRGSLHDPVWPPSFWGEIENP